MAHCTLASATLTTILAQPQDSEENSIKTKAKYFSNLIHLSMKGKYFLTRPVKYNHLKKEIFKKKIYVCLGKKAFLGILVKFRIVLFKSLRNCERCNKGNLRWSLFEQDNVVRGNIILVLIRFQRNNFIFGPFTISKWFKQYFTRKRLKKIIFLSQINLP